MQLIQPSFDTILKVTGLVNLKLYDKSGFLKQEITTPNIVVTQGKELIAARMRDADAAAQPSHMAIGVGDGNGGVTAAVNADTALQAITGSRTALVTAGGTRTGAVLTYSCQFLAGNGTGKIVESAIFNSSSGGSMLCRTTFGVITKNSGDRLDITWSLTIN